MPGPGLGGYWVSKCDSCLGLLSCCVLTGTTTVTLSWGWADSHSGPGDGCHPEELWLGKESEPQRACGVCTSIQHRRWLQPAVCIPFAQQAWPFMLLLGLGEVIATLCLLSCSKEQIAKDLLSGEEEEETQSSADDLTPSVTSHEASDLFHNQSGCRSHRPGPRAL